MSFYSLKTADVHIRVYSYMVHLAGMRPQAFRYSSCTTCSREQRNKCLITVRANSSDFAYIADKGVVVVVLVVCKSLHAVSSLVYITEDRTI